MPEDKDSLAGKFETVHNHLDYVDRTLDEIAREIESIINNEINDIPLDVDYDIDDGSIEARIPVDKVAARVNRRLDPPFFVEIEDNTLVVNDIRNVYDGEVEPTDIVDASKHGGIKSVKALISTLEETHPDGAPEEQVVKLLVYSGLDRPQAEQELDKLRQKGEIYEPARGHLRAT